MSEAECRLADWRAIGFEDGSCGKAASAFGAHRRACAEHEVAADFDAYLAGHARGLEAFCKPENGARLGSEGRPYSGVCPAHLEPGFLAAHRPSFGLYQRRAAIDTIVRQINASLARADEVERRFVETGARLVAPQIPPADRVSLALELKHLADERAFLETRLHDLEVSKVEAQQEYDHYRGRFVNAPGI